MNLIAIQSQGVGNPTILTRFVDRKFDSQVQGNVDGYARADVLEMVENFRQNGLKKEDESFDPVI